MAKSNQDTNPQDTKLEDKELQDTKFQSKKLEDIESQNKKSQSRNLEDIEFQNKKSKDFNEDDLNIKEEFQDLLKHSQHLIWEYGALLERLQTIISNLDIPIQLLCKDIIESYSKKIENHTNIIFKINTNFYKNQSPEIKKLLAKIAEDNKIDSK